MHALLNKNLEEDVQRQRLIKHVSSSTNTNNLIQSIKCIGKDLFSNNPYHTFTSSSVLIFTLYASLPPQAQIFVLQPKPAGCTRKIILATNITETFVTLDGVRSSSAAVGTGDFMTLFDLSLLFEHKNISF